MDSLSLEQRGVPACHGDLNAERAALASGDACVDLRDYAFVDVLGDDRLAYLQTKLTQHTGPWPAQGGGYTTAVDIDGKLVFDAWAWALDDRVRLVMPPGLREGAIAHLDKFVILEDVRFETPDLDLWLVGDAAADGLPAPDGATWQAQGARAIVRMAHVGPIERALIVPKGDAPGVGVPVGAHAWAEATIDAGAVLVGRDAFVGETIPIEAGLWHGISFRKGCYLGQEVIERLFSRGRPNKRLMALRWQGDAVDARTPLLADGKSAGFVTASFSRDGEVHALGYVRRKHLASDALHVGDAQVKIGAFVGGEAPTEV